MVTEVKTEQATQEAESSLEKALSSEAVEASPKTEIDTPTDEVETTEPADDTETEKPKAEKVKPDPELEGLLKNPKVKSLLQSEKDKAVNQYRQTREGDTALIRSQAAKIKELSVKQTESKLTKAMQAVLAGDEEEGVEPDKLEAKRKDFEEIKASIREYNEKAAEVAEVAEAASSLVKTLDKGIVVHFNLDDANPTIRAKGITELVAESVYFINYKEALDKILDETPLLQKGSEVRKQIDSFVTEYMELSPGKARDLLIEKIKRELSVTPKRKPPTPSGNSGGGIDKSQLTATERIALAISKFDKGK